MDDVWKRFDAGERPKFRLWCKRISGDVEERECDCYSCFWVTIDWRWRLAWWVRTLKVVILGWTPRGNGRNNE